MPPGYSELTQQTKVHSAPSRIARTQVHGRHLLGHVLVDEGDAQREERRRARAVQQLAQQEQPHVEAGVAANALLRVAVHGLASKRGLRREIA